MAGTMMNIGGSRASTIKTSSPQNSMAQAAKNLFDKLPIETTQEIATYLSDFDLCNFRAICRSTHDAIDADNNSFWRRRFLLAFEKPVFSEGVSIAQRGALNIKFKEQYQKRRRVLLYGAKFEAALNKKSPREMRKSVEVLEVLRDLIIDSFSDKPADAVDNSRVYESANIVAITRFVKCQDVLQLVFAHERPCASPLPTRCTRSARGANALDILSIPKELLTTLQVLMAPILLDLSTKFTMYNFPSSRQAVYGTAERHPIFGGCHNLDINMDWVLHHINFWRYHMLRESEHTLFHAYEDLEPDERPRFWSSQLKQGRGDSLGTHWKGSYAYLDRSVISTVRENGEELDPDEFNGDEHHGTGSFQDLRLDLVPGADPAQWPAIFEDFLHSLSAPRSRAKTRAQIRTPDPESIAAHRPQNFQFTGEGRDITEEFYAQGWLNALPPQHGVPGWQRMTMMKYFQDDDIGEIDYEALWAYEGIVLPGGQIILGRWWSPGDGTGETQYSGPFILWNVDGPRHNDAEKAG